MRPDKQMFFNFDKCKVWCPRSHGDDDKDADDNDDQARNQDFMWGGGGGGEGGRGLKRPKWTKLPKCTFYCLIRLFREVAIHEKL